MKINKNRINKYFCTSYTKETMSYNATLTSCFVNLKVTIYF